MITLLRRLILFILIHSISVFADVSPVPAQNQETNQSAAQIVQVRGNPLWSAGLLLGVAVLSDGLGTQGAVGATIRYRWNPNFAIGGTVTSHSFGNEVTSGVTYNQKLIHLDLDLLFYPNEKPSGFWFGPRLGYAIASYSSQPTLYQPTLSSSKVFDWGFVVGLDSFVSEKITIGAEGSMMNSNPSQKFLSVFQILAAVKSYW